MHTSLWGKGHVYSQHATLCFLGQVMVMITCSLVCSAILWLRTNYPRVILLSPQKRTQTRSTQDWVHDSCSVWKRESTGALHFSSRICSNWLCVITRKYHLISWRGSKNGSINCHLCFSMLWRPEVCLSWGFTITGKWSFICGYCRPTLEKASVTYCETGWSNVPHFHSVAQYLSSVRKVCHCNVYIWR